MRYIIFILLLSTPSYAQQKVKIDDATKNRLGLKNSDKNTYMVYTFKEYKELLKKLATLESLKKKVPFLNEKVQLYKTAIKAKDAVIKAKSDTIDILNTRSERLTKNYYKCVDEREEAKAGSWKPWVVTATSLLVAAVTSGLAGYYGIKYKLK